jgi:hypothetical protein
MLITKDIVEGNVIILRRNTVLDEEWTDKYNPYHNPSERRTIWNFADVGPSAVREMDQKYLDRMKTDIMSVADRISADELISVLGDYKKVSDATRHPFHWKDGGLFLSEMYPNADSDEEDDEDGDDGDDVDQILLDEANAIVLPVPGINPTVLVWVMDNVAIGNFMAWRIEYSEQEIERAKKKSKKHDLELPKFWYGKVTELHPTKNTVTVHYFHCAKDYGNYKPWTNIRDKFVEVSMSCVLHVTNSTLTGSGLIPSPDRTCIKERIRAWDEADGVRDAVMQRAQQDEEDHYGEEDDDVLEHEKDLRCAQYDDADDDAPLG